MARSVTKRGRHSAGAVAGRLHPDPQGGSRERQRQRDRKERKRERLGLTRAFETSKPNTSGISPTRSYHLILPKQFQQTRPNIEIYELMGPFSFKLLQTPCVMFI